MPIYIPTVNVSLVKIDEADKASNQVVLTGANQTYDVPDGIFFLELLQVVAGGTVIIADGDGNVIGTVVGGFTQDHSPLRCDRGITLTGNVSIAKGFCVRSIFVK